MSSKKDFTSHIFLFIHRPATHPLLAAHFFRQKANRNKQKNPFLTIFVSTEIENYSFKINNIIL